MSTARIGLDSPVFAGRLRDFSRASSYLSRPTPVSQPRGISDVFVSSVKPTKNTAQSAAAAATKVQPNFTLRSGASTINRKPISTRVLARQYTPKPTDKKRHWRPGLQHLLPALAVLLLLAGAGVAFMGWRTNKHVVAQTQAAVADNQDQEAIAETKPSDQEIGNYTVAPNLPRYIRVPKIGVNAIVRRQGVDRKGAIQSPSNIHAAGWYDGSSKPGEGGAVLIDGHVSGPSQSGVFVNLKKLGVGDVIELERGDATVFKYKVVKTQTTKADKVDMAAALLPVVPGKGGLNLITCTGKISGTNYEDRLVVYATQI